MGQLRYICIHMLTQCRSTSHCKDVQSHFLDVNVYKWMLSSTPIEVEVAQIFSSETKIVNKHFSERAHFIWFVMIKMPFCPPPFRRKAEGHSFRHSILPSFRPSVLPSFRPPNIVGTLCAQLLLQFYADSFETLQMF